MEKLELLEEFLKRAQKVCDPLDYSVRQRDLLYMIAEVILDPLYESREKEIKPE